MRKQCLLFKSWTIQFAPCMCSQLTTNFVLCMCSQLIIDFVLCMCSLLPRAFTALTLSNSLEKSNYFFLYQIVLKWQETVWHNKSYILINSTVCVPRHISSLYFSDPLNSMDFFWPNMCFLFFDRFCFTCLLIFLCLI